MMGTAQTNLSFVYAKTMALILKRDILLALAVALVVICIGTYLGQENNNLVPINALDISHYRNEPSNPLSFLSNWDGPNYIQISQSGYENVSQTNFFPFYPLAVAVVNLIVASPLTSAILVSWLSFVGAIYFYLKILKRQFHLKNNTDALRGVLFFVFFPSAIFFLATYTEALFACLALAAIYSALRKDYLAAGLLSMLASLTHITGVFVLALVVMILFEEKLERMKILVAGGIGSLGILSFMDFLFLKFQNPFAFITAQQNHGWLEHHYSILLSEVDVVNFLIIILIVASAFYWWNKRRSFSIYVLLYLCIPLLGGQIGGFDRYALMAFPVPFMLFAIFRQRMTGYALTLAAFAILWTHYVFLYSGGYIGG